jgi:hypothetical protein
MVFSFVLAAILRGSLRSHLRMTALPWAHLISRFKFQTAGHASAFPARVSARGLLQKPCPSMSRGRRECRVSDAPVVRAKNARGIRHRLTGFNRHSLRNGFTVSFALSLVTGLVCHHHRCDANIITDLTPASGRQDHTTSPSASRAVRQKRYRRPPHPVPNVRDDGQRPPYGHGTEVNTLMICGGREENYFLQQGWTGQIALQ